MSAALSACYQAVRERLRRPRAETAGTGPFSAAVASTHGDLEDPVEPRSELRIDRMMRVFHVDRRELEEDYTKILLDAELTCLGCREKRRCLRELQRGSAVANAEHFCPNADILFVFANDQAGTVFRR